MKNISDIRVSEARAFIPDYIPFNSLLTPTNMKAFVKDFNFRDLKLGEDENKSITNIVLKTGEFQFKKKVYPVEQLSISRNLIEFSIYGDSAIAGKLYKTIESKLLSIDTANLFNSKFIVAKTSETACVVNLNFDYNQIFSNNFNKFISNDVPKFCNKSLDFNVDMDVSIDIIPNQLLLEVRYGIGEVKDHQKIKSEVLRIEPRWGVDIKERRYFTSSPCDSKTHLQLLTKLESKFIKKRKLKNK